MTRVHDSERETESTAEPQSPVADGHQRAPGARAAPNLDARSVMWLQGSAGNRAVTGYLASRRHAGARVSRVPAGLGAVELAGAPEESGPELAPEPENGPASAPPPAPPSAPPPPADESVGDDVLGRTDDVGQGVAAAVEGAGGLAKRETHATVARLAEAAGDPRDELESVLDAGAPQSLEPMPLRPGVGMIRRVAASPDAPVEVPEVPAIQLPDAQPHGLFDESHVRGAGREVEQAGSGGGGGILGSIADFAMSALRGLVSGASGIVSSATNGVAGTVTGAIETGFGAIRSVGSTLGGLVSGGLRGALSGLGGVLGGITGGIRGTLHGIMGGASTLLQPLKAAIKAAVMRAVQGPGDMVSSILAPVRNAITGIISKITGLVTQVTTAISNALNSAVNAIVGLTNRVADALNGAVDGAVRTITGVLDRVEGLMNRARVDVDQRRGGIGGAIMSVIGGIVNRVLDVVRSIASRIIAIVRRVVSLAQRTIHSIINRIRDTLIRAIRWAQQTAQRIAKTVKDTIVGTIRRAISAAQTMINWVRSHVAALWRRVAMPIAQAIARAAAQYVAPYIRAAVAQAKKLTTNAGETLSQGAQEMITGQAANIVQAEAHDVLQGILKPDGDHFSVGLSATAAAQLIGGVGITGGVTLDVVVDYRHHQIGFFISPAVQAQSYLGAEVKEGGEVDVGMSWGTVMSMGSKRGAGYGVEDVYGGAFNNVGVGVGAAYGVDANKGYNFYMGARSVFNPQQFVPGTTTPGTTTPGTTTPGTTTPGTPDHDDPVTTGVVLFRTGKSDVQDDSDIQRCVAAARARHAANPGSTIRIRVVGEASRRFRHPDKQGADADNLRLSRERAGAVTAQIQAALGPEVGTVYLVTAESVGSDRARQQRVGADDDSQSFRDVTISVVEHVPGTPGTTTPGTTTPGTTTPGTTTPGHWEDDASNPDWIPPYLPDVMHGNRPTIGWDSTLSAGVGGEAGASVYGGVGMSYSIPGSKLPGPLKLSPVPFPPESELPLRIIFGVVKLGFDAATADVAGAIRDAIGIIGPAIDAAFDNQLIEPFVDSVIPLPPGTH